jgi:hypothetical protein
LNGVTVPGSVREIGNSAFNGCSALADIILSNGVADIDEDAFYYSGVTQVIIPDTVTNIGDYAFYFCTSLTNVSIPGSVANIGNGTFQACGLTSVTIPFGVTNIASSAFIYCPLGSLTMADSVVAIGSDAFAYCTLTNVTIPDSVQAIGDFAFTGTLLTNVTIPRNISSMGNGVFADCTALTGIFADPANSYFSSLDGVLFNQSQTELVQFPTGRRGSYVIPPGVGNIRAYAFYPSAGLTNVTVPGSVTNISETAFGECYNLTGIYFEGNAPTFNGVYIFGSDDALTVYYLPGATGWGPKVENCPTALWLPSIQTVPAASSAAGPSNFNINWASGQTVVVEACSTLAQPDWQPVQTNTLTTGSAPLSDPQWTNYPARFYRVRTP